MRWIWDDAKNAANKRKHRLSFETAALVFEDPLALTRPYPSFHDEERWQTVGTIGVIGGIAVFVSHTVAQVTASGGEVGRIISARKATAHEKEGL